MKKYYKWIDWLLVLIYMFIILSFSSDAASASGAKSGFLTGLITPAVEKACEFLGIGAPERGELDTAVRKCAHMFNYCVLSLLSCNAFYATFRKKIGLKRLLLYSWLLAAGFSAFDEFYQTFIPGRAGRISDVLIDNIGIFAGLLIVCAVSVHINKKRSA